MKAFLKQVRISPKKANLVAGIVRGKMVEEAEEILKYLPKKAAQILRKLIVSAAANAENNFGQDKTKLTIKHILVTKGPIYKRWIPVSRGRSHPILKRTTHIHVELSLETPQKLPVGKKQEEKQAKGEVEIQKQGAGSKEPRTEKKKQMKDRKKKS